MVRAVAIGVAGEKNERPLRAVAAGAAWLAVLLDSRDQEPIVELNSVEDRRRAWPTLARQKLGTCHAWLG